MINENEKYLPIRALSIRQPWAWLITNGFKSIENRTWNTRYRGEFLIHASKKFSLQEWDSALYIAELSGIKNLPYIMEYKKPIIKELCGGIVGSAKLINTINESQKILFATKDKPWFFGPYGFVLDNQQELPFTPCKGQLGFFKVDSSLFPAGSIINKIT